ncbi:MAG: Ig-like domain-containing protein [Candidatus Bathyarchaeia archaeon]
MKRRGVSGTILALSVAAVFLVSCVAPALRVLGGVMNADAGVSFAATELLGRPTDTSMSVNIVPSSNGEVYFEYGTVAGVYTGQTSAAALVSDTPADLVIQDLSPNTRYYYRMVSSSDDVNWVAGNEYSFETQRSEGSTFSFTITADSHVNITLGNAATWQQTMTNVANQHPDFEVDLGDTFAMDSVTTAAGADQAYLGQRQFFDIAGSSAPVFLVVGNHEQQEAWHLNDTPSPANSPPVMGVNAEKMYYLDPVPDGFYSGNTDPYSYISGDHLREDYYAWTWGDALFVVIDPYWYTLTKPYIGDIGGGESSTPGSGNRWNWTLGLQQFNWLKQTLENSHAKYKFVFAHHMVGGASDYGGRGGAVPANLVEWGGYNVDGVTWGWNANRNVTLWGTEPIEQILMDNNVTAFFHGHDHEYAYESRDGIVYQCVPAAGFSGYGFNSYSVGTYTHEVLPSPGDLRVTVSPANVTVDYVFSDPGKSDNGQVMYSYSIMPNAGDNAPVAYNQTVNTSEDAAVAVNLTASDVDGDSLSYQIVTSPAHGSLSGTAPYLTYTPTPGYTGLDSFTFEANDGVKDSNIATVTVSVTAATGSALLLTVAPSQASYAKGQQATLAVNVFNQQNPPLNSTLTLTVTGPNNYYYFDFQPVSVSAGAVGEYSFSWVAPAVSGTYVVEVGLVPAQLTAYDTAWLIVK